MDSETEQLDVPIENIYYLLCYAWNRLEQRDLVTTGTVPSNELVDLLGHVLARGLSHVLRRGLEQGYVLRSEDVAGVRGKIEIGETAKRLLHLNARTRCAFDELSHNTLSNQLVKATVAALLGDARLHKDIRALLGQHYRRLRHISFIAPNRSLFRRVQLHRNNSFYGFLLDVCELIVDNVIPTEYAGRTTFRNFLRDATRMPKLFQDFVVNFLKREQRYPVRAPRIEWAGAKGSADALRVLPGMQTDAVVFMVGRQLILDTKFYKSAMARGQFGESLHSSNLYQMFAYMKNMSASIGQNIRVDGMLLYPTVRYDLDLEYEIDGHTLRVSTIDLAQPWKNIHDNLVRLVATSAKATVPALNV